MSSGVYVKDSSNPRLENNSVNSLLPLGVGAEESSQTCCASDTNLSSVVSGLDSPAGPSENSLVTHVSRTALVSCVPRRAHPEVSWQELHGIGSCGMATKARIDPNPASEAQACGARAPGASDLFASIDGTTPGSTGGGGALRGPARGGINRNSARASLLAGAVARDDAAPAFSEDLLQKGAAEGGAAIPSRAGGACEGGNAVPRGLRCGAGPRELGDSDRALALRDGGSVSPRQGCGGLIPDAVAGALRRDTPVGELPAGLQVSDDSAAAAPAAAAPSESPAKNTAEDNEQQAGAQPLGCPQAHPAGSSVLGCGPANVPMAECASAAAAAAGGGNASEALVRSAAACPSHPNGSLNTAERSGFASLAAVEPEPAAAAGTRAQDGAGCYSPRIAGPGPVRGRPRGNRAQAPDRRPDGLRAGEQAAPLSPSFFLSRATRRRAAARRAS